MTSSESKHYIGLVIESTLYMLTCQICLISALKNKKLFRNHKISKNRFINKCKTCEKNIYQTCIQANYELKVADQSSQIVSRHRKILLRPPQSAVIDLIKVATCENDLQLRKLFSLSDEHGSVTSHREI